MLPSHRGRSDSALRSERSCVLARRGIVCASVPLAAAAGVELLRRGGNAVDAALAAAAALCVVEPMQTGLGGDLFALLWSAREERLVGLNGSGRSPAGATLEAYRARGLEAMPAHGALSITVPGALHAWESLSRRFGRVPLGQVLEPAVRAATDGFAVSELVAHYWYLLHAGGALRNGAARESFAPGGRTPAAGSWCRRQGLARTLRAVAEGGAAAFYQGALAQKIVEAVREEGGLLDAEDLAAHASSWVEPLRTTYRGVTVAELPPNGQGVTALLALNLLETFDPAEAPSDSALDWHRKIEVVKLAFAERDAHVADPEYVTAPIEQMLDPDFARERARRIGPRAQAHVASGIPRGDTTYVCAADAEGNLVSLIQSLFGGFGSGIACGDTGILLQNRGAGFRLDPGHPNALAPRKRPLHTLIPGMLLREGVPWMAFGIMGGDVQPQAHLSFVSNLVDFRLNPQEALDRARFRWVSGPQVEIETPDAPVREGGRLEAALAARGHTVLRPPGVMADRFGGGQAVAREADGTLVGASDRRKDGCALGLWE